MGGRGRQILGFSRRGLAELRRLGRALLLRLRLPGDQLQTGRRAEPRGGGELFRQPPCPELVGRLLVERGRLQRCGDGLGGSGRGVSRLAKDLLRRLGQTVHHLPAAFHPFAKPARPDVRQHLALGLPERHPRLEQLLHVLGVPSRHLVRRPGRHRRPAQRSDLRRVFRAAFTLQPLRQLVSGGDELLRRHLEQAIDVVFVVRLASGGHAAGG